MALIFCDGWETPLSTNSQGIWSANEFAGPVHGAWEYSTTYARTGTYSLRYSSSNGILGFDEPKYQIGHGATYTELYYGFGWLWDNDTYVLAQSGGETPLIMGISNNGYPIFCLSFNIAALTLQLWTGRSNETGIFSGTYFTNIDSGIQTLTEKAWNYIDFHMLIGGAGVGRGRTWVNGAADIDNTTDAMQNSNASANQNVITSQYGPIRTGINGGLGGQTWMDDFVVADTTGTILNGQINQKRVGTMFPNADGTYSAWTSTGGAVDYTQIDDTETGDPDGNTTRIYSTTATQRTSVNMTDVNSNTVFFGIQLCTMAALDIASSATITDFVIVNSTDYDQAAWTPPTSYAWHLTPITASPDTGVAWTEAELDAIEFGWLR